MSTRIAQDSRRPWLLLGVLLTAPFMAQADVTIVNVATPSVRADLGASGAALQLVVGGYLIALAMTLITGARLGQAFGYAGSSWPGCRCSRWRRWPAVLPWTR